MNMNYKFEVHTKTVSAKCPIIYIRCYNSDDLNQSSSRLSEAGFQYVATTETVEVDRWVRFRTAEKIMRQYLKAENDIACIIEDRFPTGPQGPKPVLIYVRKHILNRPSFPFLVEAYENTIGRTLAEANYLPDATSKQTVFTKARDLAAEAKELGLSLGEEYTVEQNDKRLQDPDFLELLQEEKNKQSEMWDRIIAAGLDTEPRMGLPD